MQRFRVKEEELLYTFLSKTFPSMSRSKLKNLLSCHRVLVNGCPISQYNFNLLPDTLVEISSQSKEINFHSQYLRIIYEDRWLIIIEKNTGVLSMGSPHHPFSIKTILDEYFSQKHLSVRSHVVHRLDRETSGIMVYAKTTEVQGIFRNDWHNRVTDRRYYAIIEGALYPRSGTISSWLKDNKSFFTYSSPIDNGGKYAVTHYCTIASNSNYSLIELQLETGRKNQIRVHLQDLGHPIVGDYKYGSQINPIGRLCLHAFRLNFTHPITKEQINFETPYPSSFTKLISKPMSERNK